MRKSNFSARAVIPEPHRVQVLKILGVTLHVYVQFVITSCAQTLCALRVLRARGLCESALQTVFRAVVRGYTDLLIKSLVGFCQFHRPSKT